MSKSSDIFFSVIIPTHDRPIELVRALQSIGSQTHSNYEVVVVNDGDADVTDAIQESGLLSAGKKVSLVKTSGHSGPSLARNAGLEVARGDCIAYLDDDDIYHPHHLEMHAQQYAAASDCMVVYSDAERCTVTNGGDKVEVVHSVDFDADTLLVYNYIPVISLSHRRECLEKTGSFEPSLFYLEDWDLFIRFSKHWSFVHVNEATARYFETGTGTSVQEVYRDRYFDSLDAVYNRAEDALGSDPVRQERVQSMRLRYIGGVIFDTARHFEDAGELEAAADAYNHAMNHYPTPEGYLALAKVHKKLGRKKEAIIATMMAEQCREQV